jgi:VWFA-related protein
MRQVLLILLVSLAVLSRSAPITSAQNPTTPTQTESDGREKPQLKKFGESLKRLKWDPTKQRAVETDSTKKSETDAESVVRITTDLVVCDFLVLDQQGQPVPSLTKDDFLISEDNQPQQVAHFSLGNETKVGRSIVLVIDYSGSLAPYIDLSVNAAKKFIDQLNPKDRVAIVTNEVTLLVDFTTDRLRLRKALESIKITAVTHKIHSFQFSALLATAKEMFDEEDVRPIIIFQTDGDEIDQLQPPSSFTLSNSILRALIRPFSLDDVRAAIEKSHATLYSVIPAPRLIGLPEAEQLKRAQADAEGVIISNGWGGDRFSRQPYHLDKKSVAEHLAFRLRGHSAVAEVAKSSGGWTSYLEDPKQAEGIYANILTDINSRYELGYYPTNKTHDGKRRTISIMVRQHPEYRVWGRNSYLAPKD